jgi:hypothetical protein
MERRYNMSRRNRRHWKNIEIAKKIAKHLILRRCWEEINQTNLAKDMDITYQQWSKFETIQNRIYAEQLMAICDKRNWDLSQFKSKPEDILQEWLERDYPDTKAVPTKYMKITRLFKRLDIQGNAWYNINQLEEPIPFVVDSIERKN